MPFMAVQLNTRSYGVAGESRDVIFCTIVENDTGCNAVVYDIESKKCTEHPMWRVVGGREIEAAVEIKMAAQLSYIEWHKEKIKGFTSGDNARASRAAAAAAAAKEKERERDAAASKPAKSGVGKNKASGDDADGDDEVAPVDPPPVKLLKLTRSEARVMFATKTSVHQRKKSEDSNGYRTRLHAAGKAFGKKPPETFRNCDCQEFLMKAPGLRRWRAMALRLALLLPVRPAFLLAVRMALLRTARRSLRQRDGRARRARRAARFTMSTPTGASSGKSRRRCNRSPRS